MNAKALVLIGGEFPPAERIGALWADGDFVVAADSGLDAALALGLPVDLVVGDMDSVSAGALAGVQAARQRRSPVAKAETDTELAILAAREAGFQRLILAGGGGGRLEHLLALHSLFLRHDAPDRWYTERDEVILIRQYAELPLAVGTVLGFFPLAAGTRARTEGLRWPLDALVWGPGDCGISNEAACDLVRVEIVSGALLMVRTLPIVNGGPVPWSARIY